MSKKDISKINFKNKKVLLRVDFNVPVDQNNQIKNDAKIRESLKTIQHLFKQKAIIIILAHRSEVKGSDTKPSYKPLISQISKILRKPITFLDILNLKNAKNIIDKLKPGEIAMFENTRFHPGEEINDEKFSKQIASLGDIYVYDAFPSHRPHASTVGLTKHLPSVIGFQANREVAMLRKVTKNPKKPVLAMIGGAKTEIKVKLVEKFISTSDYIILGGAVANTFLKALGFNLGKSLVDEEMVPIARKLIHLALKSRVKLLLPEDVIVAHHQKMNNIKIKHHSELDDDEAIFDIGPKSLELYESVISKAKTVVWNGPFGKYENPEFIKGTKKLLSYVAKYENISILGGGDTLGIIDAKTKKNITYVSTAGGAMLKFLEKGTIAPIEAIEKSS